MSEDLHKNICNQNLFKVFFKKHSKNLHDFLYYKFGERLNPQDKVQDAFIKLWENCKKVPPNKAKSYVYTIANNLMLNEVAHQKVVLKHQKNANLTEAERVAFLMNRTEGKRFKEIAEILDISTKAVEKRIYGALKKLRKEIEGL